MMVGIESALHKHHNEGCSLLLKTKGLKPNLRYHLLGNFVKSNLVSAINM